MPRLIWTPAALRDVQRLHRFLNTRNPEAARRAVKAVKAGVGHLGRYPEAGRPTTLSEGAMREAVVSFGRGGYVVLYRADGDAIYLLSVRHGREAGY